MSLRERLTRILRAPIEVARAATNYQLASLYGTPPNAERIREGFVQFAEHAFRGNAVVFSLESKRMNTFSEANVKFRALDDKHLYGKPALDKLQTPWPGGTIHDLFRRMIQYADIGGTAYVRDAGDQLEVLRPDWVTVVSEVKDDGVGGQIREVLGVVFDTQGADPDRDPDFYPVDEVAMWSPSPDPCANWRGMSWLTPVVREVDADIRMSAFRDAYFSNAATANIIVKYAQHVGKDKIEALRAMITSKHAGADNAFGTLVFDEGGDPVVVGSNMEGAAFDAIQAAGETRLAAAAGVPPLVAGLRQGMASSAPGEYPAAVRAFIDLTMRPLWRSACAALAKLVDVPPGAELWYDTADISALRQGEADAAATLVQLSAAANTWIMAGYEPDSVTAVLSSGDVSLLKHSGLVSVQMQNLEAKNDLTNAAPGERVPLAVTDKPSNLKPAKQLPPGPSAQRAGQDITPGHNQLEHYWTVGEGLAKWATDPHPWTALYHHLIKYLPPNEAKRTAAQWYHQVFHRWPGETKGKNPVGPG